MGSVRKDPGLTPHSRLMLLQHALFGLFVLLHGGSGKALKKGLEDDIEEQLGSIDNMEEVKSIQPVKSIKEVKSIQEVKHITPIEEAVHTMYRQTSAHLQHLSSQHPHSVYHSKTHFANNSLRRNSSMLLLSYKFYNHLGCSIPGLLYKQRSSSRPTSSWPVKFCMLRRPNKSHNHSCGLLRGTGLDWQTAPRWMFQNETFYRISC